MLTNFQYQRLWALRLLATFAINYYLSWSANNHKCLYQLRIMHYSITISLLSHIKMCLWALRILATLTKFAPQLIAKHQKDHELECSCLLYQLGVITCVLVCVHVWGALYVVLTHQTTHIRFSHSVHIHGTFEKEWYTRCCLHTRSEQVGHNAPVLNNQPKLSPPRAHTEPLLRVTELDFELSCMSTRSFLDKQADDIK